MRFAKGNEERTVADRRFGIQVGWTRLFVGLRFLDREGFLIEERIPPASPADVRHVRPFERLGDPAGRTRRPTWQESGAKGNHRGHVTHPGPSVLPPCATDPPRGRPSAVRRCQLSRKTRVRFLPVAREASSMAGNPSDGAGETPRGSRAPPSSLARARARRIVLHVRRDDVRKVRAQAWPAHIPRLSCRRATHRHDVGHVLKREAHALLHLRRVSLLFVVAAVPRTRRTCPTRASHRRFLPSPASSTSVLPCSSHPRVRRVDPLWHLRPRRRACSISFPSKHVETKRIGGFDGA